MTRQQRPTTTNRAHYCDKTRRSERPRASRRAMAADAVSAVRRTDAFFAFQEQKARHRQALEKYPCHSIHKVRTLPKKYCCLFEKIAVNDTNRTMRHCEAVATRVALALAEAKQTKSDSQVTKKCQSQHLLSDLKRHLSPTRFPLGEPTSIDV